MIALYNKRFIYWLEQKDSEGDFCHQWLRSFSLRIFQLGPLAQLLIDIPHGPVSFEEVGLGDILPPDSCLDALSGHSAPEQRDVLRVRRLEGCVLEDPETVS